MEITIKRYSRKMTYEDAATLDEFWELAKRTERSLDREQRRHWDGRECDEYIIAAQGILPYCATPEELACQKETLDEILAVLLDRAHLSQLNGWTDEVGRVYLVFPVEKIAAALNRSLSSAKNALAELSAAGLIERKRRGQFLPNLIYVKLPEGQRIVPPQTDNGLSFTEAENDLRNS